MINLAYVALGLGLALLVHTQHDGVLERIRRAPMLAIPLRHRIDPFRQAEARRVGQGSDPPIRTQSLSERSYTTSRDMTRAATVTVRSADREGSWPQYPDAHRPPLVGRPAAVRAVISSSGGRRGLHRVGGQHDAQHLLRPVRSHRPNWAPLARRAGAALSSRWRGRPAEDRFRRPAHARVDRSVPARLRRPHVIGDFMGLGHLP
jgi:hypothetical protein